MQPNNVVVDFFRMSKLRLHYRYARNRKRYSLWLYLGIIFMTVFSFSIEHYMPTSGLGYGNHNIFLNLFG